ncbi:uncharacterized protein LOC130735462 [Lotus japonicus]|uniref:uncharacterized protein LOC130735462 n=1 Tax=Lotus japonicus TaxID=34305 RepID=UPI00258938F3|nr:uncharacterized protein LOC130735462 [Lotus japonicus]
MAKRKSQGRRKSHVAGSSHDATEDVEDRHTAPEDVEDRHRRLHASYRRVKGRFGEDQDVGGTSYEERRDPCEMTPEPSRQTTPEPSPPSRQMTPQSSTESEHEVDVEPEVDVELQVDVEPEVDVELECDAGARRDEVPVQTEAPFPGGPDDLSLLVRYPHHVAPCLWHHIIGTDPRYPDRGVLKFASAGMKLAKLTCEGEGDDMSAVRQRVEGTGLYPLFRCTYPEIDTPLLSALVERWHEDTSSFHMPFGEMTITLDDVSSILHLPMGDRFYTPGQASREQAAETCVLLLGGVATD